MTTDAGSGRCWAVAVRVDNGPQASECRRLEKPEKAGSRFSPEASGRLAGLLTRE